MKLFALSLLLAIPFLARPDSPCPAQGATGPLKLSDLTLDKSHRFSVSAPASFVVPTGIAFVLTDASSYGDVFIVINGFTRAHLPTSAILRTFDPPIIAHAGDTFALTGGPGIVNLGGYVVAPADVATIVPSAPVPLALKDFALDRGQHYWIPNAAGGWTLPNPPATGVSLVLVSWFGFPASFSVNGNTVAEVGMSAAGLKEYRLPAPIIVGPGQTLNINSIVANDGELGGYFAYPGET